MSHSNYSRPQLAPKEVHPGVQTDRGAAAGEVARACEVDQMFCSGGGGSSATAWKRHFPDSSVRPPRSELGAVRETAYIDLIITHRGCDIAQSSRSARPRQPGSVCGPCTLSAQLKPDFPANSDCCLLHVLSVAASLLEFGDQRIRLGHHGGIREFLVSLGLINVGPGSPSTPEHLVRSNSCPVWR